MYTILYIHYTVTLTADARPVARRFYGPPKRDPQLGPPSRQVPRFPSRRFEDPSKSCAAIRPRRRRTPARTEDRGRRKEDPVVHARGTLGRCSLHASRPARPATAASALRKQMPKLEPPNCNSPVATCQHHCLASVELKAVGCSTSY